MNPVVEPKAGEPVDPLAWARALRRREHRCERLTPAQCRMWREALKHELRAERAAKEPA